MLPPTANHSNTSQKKNNKLLIKKSINYNLSCISCRKNRVQRSTPEKERALRQFIEEHYRALGRMSRKETVVVTSFFILVMLWILRDPGFIPGWATYYTTPDESSWVFKELFIFPLRYIACSCGYVLAFIKLYESL